MFKENEKFNYLATPERQEKWEQPIAVTNAVAELSQPVRQRLESHELTPLEIVDIDDRALRNKNCPNICFGRPHAGELVPTDLWQRADPEVRKVLTSIDRGTGDIFRSPRIPSVGTKISRYIIDPNRAPILNASPENPRVPGKVLWQTDAMFTGKPIYQAGQEPTEEEVKELTERLYLPYYDGMMGVIGSLADGRTNTQERILVIDGHSFPTHSEFAFYKQYGVDNPASLPLFIIGDREGQACDLDIREAFAQALEKNFHTLTPKQQKTLLTNIDSGQLVGKNYPFKGVHNVQFYGQRQQGINSLQLELNESGYIKESRDNYFDFSYDEERLIIMQRLIEQACLDVDPLLKK